MLRTHCYLLVYFISMFFPALLGAQVLITYTNPEGPDVLTVCNEAVFSFTFTNNGSSTLTNVNSSIRFPSGVLYQVGSINNGSELDVSNLSNPQFSLVDLLPNASITINLRAKAGCDLVADINAGQLFTNEIVVNADGGISNSIITDPYTIETPLLVIFDATNLILSGAEGDVRTRTFTIRNTRLGPLSEFVFKDSFGSGIGVSVSPGVDISSSSNTLEVRLDGSHFNNIGDGDNLFELDEEITITEEVTITDCGQATLVSFSEIQACWGCDGNICQATTPIAARVDILPSTIDTPLIFEPFTEVPECFCLGDTEAESGIQIINQSPADALNIGLTIRQLSVNSGLLPSSFLVDSNGVLTSISPLVDSLVIFNDPNCGLLDDLYEYANIIIPRIAAGDTLTLRWKANYCEDVCFGQPSNSWTYDFVYTRDCPPNPIFSEEGIRVDSTKIKKGRITFDGESEIDDGGEKPYTFQLISDYLLSSTGELTLSFEIPCGLLWDNSTDLSFGGRTPSSQSIINTGSGTLITASYPLPLSSDSLELDFIFGLDCDSLCEEVCLPRLNTSCTEFCPASTMYFFNINAFFDLDQSCNDNCEIAVCLTQNVSIPCVQEECPADTIPGYARYDFQIFRTNYGLPDNDNNRILDNGGQINLDSIRTDRAMFGDTIRVAVDGEVVIDQPGTTFAYGAINLDMRFSRAGPSGTALNSPTGLPVIAEELQIYDQSANQWYTCNDLNGITTVSTQGSYELIVSLDVEDLSNLSCGIPLDFVFEDEDSIKLTMDFRVAQNLAKTSVNAAVPPVGILTLTPAVFLYQTPTVAEEDLFNCKCIEKGMSISGIAFDAFVGNYPIPPCEPSRYISGSFFRLALGFDNFFPYEFRSLGELEDWILVLPDEFSIAETKLLFLQRQDQTLLLNERPLSVTANGNRWMLELQNVIDFPIDEGYIATFQYQFEADCSLTGNFPLEIEAGISLPPNLAPLDTGNIISQNTAGLRMLLPRVNINTLLPNITSFDDKGRWDFFIDNQPTVIASTESGAAQNVWVAPISNTGGLTDFKLINTETSQSYPLVNGLFQLDNLDSRDTFFLQLTAMNNSCEREELEVLFGWNCDQLLSSSSPSCFSEKEILSVISPPAELEQIVYSPLGVFDLCDTISYHTIEVFNAGLGTGYGVLVDAQLPQGLNILPGSSELSYPLGAPFVSISDPVVLGGNISRWDISGANDSIGINGLLGALSSPNDKFQIRFRTTTDCEFIAGASIVYLARAEQNCGLPTNTLAESGEPISISGVTAPYSSSLNIQALDNAACENELRYRVRFSATETTLNQDSLLINLPVGIQYVSNSIIPLTNMPNDEPLIISLGGAQQLQWKITEGLVPGTLVSFEFTTEGYQLLDCATLFLQGQSVAPANALCASDNQSCTIQVETGNSLTRVNIDRPRFDLTNFSISTSESGGMDLVDYNIEGRNIGTAADPPIIIDIYEDIDGNGRLSSTDLLLDTYNFNTAIDSGATFLINNSFLYSNTNVCQFIAVIDPDKHCQCQTDTILITAPIVSLQADTTICSGVDVSIGFPVIPGTNYQWGPSQFLSCDTCSTTIFNFDNNTSNNVDFTYSLITINNQACEVQYQFPITVLPEPAIIVPDNRICLGDSIRISTTFGQSYDWEGPGILNPSEQSQLVAPMQTSTYRVSVTNQLGCVGVDSLVVRVDSLPVVDAGVDTAFCSGSTARLNATFNPSFNYFWSPSTRVSDPTIANPIILGNSSGVFYVRVEDGNGCEAIDSVSIQLGFRPNVIASGDQIICFGDTANLMIAGANQYLWSPSNSLSCDSCQQVLATPSSTTTYTIIGSVVDGCSDTTEITVVVQGGIEQVSDEQICEGEDIELFGEVVNEEGLYCDTLISMLTGCDSLICVELEVLMNVENQDSAEICRGEVIIWNGLTLFEPGEYCDTTIAVNGCEQIDCFDLTVNDLPEVDLDTAITLILGTDTMISLPPQFSYMWSPVVGLSCADCPDPVISVEETTEYQVSIENEEGCISIINITVIVIVPPCEEPSIFVPNAFSPNGDSENDYFQVYGLAIEEMHLRVYNRWGQLVFESFDQQDHWDGRFKGRELPPDVFGYYLEALCVDGQEFRKKGNITLLK